MDTTITTLSYLENEEPSKDFAPLVVTKKRTIRDFAARERELAKQGTLSDAQGDEQDGM